MNGPWVLLLIGVPAVLVLWLLLDAPQRGRRMRSEVRYQVRATPRRVYQRARTVGGRAVRRRVVSRVDGRPTVLTVEQVGVVEPAVPPPDPAEMVPAAAQAFVETPAAEAVEQTPAYQAAAESPAAQAAAGTPLFEEVPARVEDV